MRVPIVPRSGDQAHTVTNVLNGVRDPLTLYTKREIYGML